MRPRSKVKRLGALIADFLRTPRKAHWIGEQYKWRRFAYRLRQQDRINQAFDKRFGTDTAAEIMLQDTGVPASDAARGNGIYRPFWESEFRAALKLLPIAFDGFTFVDIGSGKGKLMMLASDYPFSHIVGIEYSPGLHATAVANLQRYRSPAQRCTSFEPILGDALDFRLPPGPVVCLVFNAFDPETMRHVLGNLDRDAGDREDPVFVLYANLRTVAEIGEAFQGGTNLKQLFMSSRQIILGNAAAARDYERRKK